MTYRPTLSALVMVFFLIWGTISAQYLSNPSLEGTPQPHVPPTGWAICTFINSTPDTQPGSFGVYVPPSHGSTYLGMTARDNSTWEDVHTVLEIPFSVDSCYRFKVDLAFQEIVNGLTMLPITLKIYGHNTSCNKTNLLWQSPAIGEEEWETHEFVIHPTENDITDLVLEAYYSGTSAYWGYILIDNIRVSREPDVDLGNDTTLTLCENGELTLSAGSGFSGYIWSDGSSDSTTVVDSTGTYWVQVMNQYGCTASDTIEVVVEEYEDMAIQMLDSTYVCKGQIVTVTAEVAEGVDPYSFYWPTLGDTTASVNITIDSTAFYVVEVTDACGNVTADSIKMIVAESPDLELGPDTVVCYGDELELTPGSGFTFYIWQDGSQDSVYNASTPGWFWVTVADALGCASTDSIFIENYPPVETDLGNDTVLCEVGEIFLDAGEGWMSYLWYDGSTTQTTQVTAAGIYWVEVEDANGCTGSDTITVSLSPAVTVSLGGDTTVCSGDNYVLNPGAGFTSYTWQDGSTGGYFPVSVAGTYWVSVTDIYGCTGADTVSVMISPSPEVSLGPDTTICTGSLLDLDPGSQYSSYLWQDNSSLPVYTVSNTGLYSVTVTNVFNCPATAEVFVEVTSPDIGLGPDTLLCIGDTLYLDPGQGYSAYLWQDNSTGTVYPVTAGGDYWVQVTDSHNCSTEAGLTVSMLEVPQADLGGDQALCTGSELVLETTEGAFSYTWNGEPGGNSYSISQAGTYQVAVSNQCGTSTDEVTVTEYPVPVVYLGADQVLQSGETLDLDGGEGFDSYLWQDGSTGRYYGVSQVDVDPDNPFYWVEVWEGPCKGSDTVKVEVFRVKIPNVITPNGDGINDVFMPMEESWSGISRHHMEVFNRWGEQVWETDHFESGWDGKRNGTPVAEGTYFWVLELEFGDQGTTMTYKGTVTVIMTAN